MLHKTFTLGGNGRAGQRHMGKGLPELLSLGGCSGGARVAVADWGQ